MMFINTDISTVAARSSPSYAKASEGTLLRAGAASAGPPCEARRREAGWRRGWDSNPRYACTHNGFRDRPDRPLWHHSGGRLIWGRFRRGNRGQTSAISARNQGFPALTWGASCVYSALLRRVIQARRALSCFPASWAWVRPIPLSVVGWMVGSAQPGRLQSG